MILDGNVKWVLVCYYVIDGWSGKKNVENVLWEVVEKNILECCCYYYI